MARLTRKEIKTNIPELRELFELIDLDGRSFEKIGDKAGYYGQLLSLWRTGKNVPTLTSFVNVAEVIGYRIRLEKI